MGIAHRFFFSILGTKELGCAQRSVLQEAAVCCFEVLLAVHEHPQADPVPPLQCADSLAR